MYYPAEAIPDIFEFAALSGYLKSDKLNLPTPFVFKYKPHNIGILQGLLLALPFCGERDSNPRYRYQYNGFRNRPIRPLWHLSCISFKIYQPQK